MSCWPFQLQQTNLNHTDAFDYTIINRPLCLNKIELEWSCRPHYCCSNTTFSLVLNYISRFRFDILDTFVYFNTFLYICCICTFSLQDQPLITLLDYILEKTAMSKKSVLHWFVKTRLLKKCFIKQTNPLWKLYY